MSWWGKLAGSSFGFILGGPLGAIMGAALGHHFDKGLDNIAGFDLGDQQRTQAAFFTATFSIMGYLAKTDGHVSRDEVAMAEHVMSQMKLSQEQRNAAISLFNEGKQTDFPLDAALHQLRQECHRRTNLLQMFMEILISTAMADGALHSEEAKALSYIGQHLGFNSAYIDQLLNMVNGQHNIKTSNKPSLSSAYAVLGINKDTSDTDMKKSYRRLISQHHPDKLVAKGLPEEMIKLANEKTHEIKSAYDLIKKSREK
jgi:DnaJ like chaperone protein